MFLIQIKLLIELNLAIIMRDLIKKCLEIYINSKSILIIITFSNIYSFRLIVFYV